MIPSTPRSMRLLMSPRSFTVHGRTLSPSACAAARSPGVRLRQYIDHVPQPAAFTNAGSDPPWSRNGTRHSRARRLHRGPAARCRCPASESSSRRSRSRGRYASLRQACANRTTGSSRDRQRWPRGRRRSTVLQMSPGQACSTPWSALSSVSILNRTGLPLALARSNNSESLGKRSPSAARWFGN